MARSSQPRIPNHLILLYLTLIFAGAFGVVAGVSGTTYLSIFTVAQFQFDGIGVSIPLVVLGVASVVVTGLSVWTADAWHLSTAACFAGWAVVSLVISTASLENRIFGAAVMAIAALAFVANRVDRNERALSTRRRED